MPLLPPLLRARFRPLAARAAETLRSAGDSTYARWRDKVVVVERGQPLLAPKVPDAVFDAVQTALFEGRVIEGGYRARSRPGQGDAQRRLHPLGIVLRDQLTYLVAVESSDGPVKQFALHRFTAVRVLDEPAQRPPRFHLRRWIEEQRGMDLPTGEVARVALEVDALTAQHLEESALSRDQRIAWLDPSRAHVEATLPLTEQLLWWLLGHGRRIEVLAPAELRRRWIESAPNPSVRLRRTRPGAR
jgi:predicted DNA-binding transcriptional regulator YafY